MVFNALVHRDYSTFSLGEPIRVYINKEEFAVENPGQLFTGNDNVSLKMKYERNPFLKKTNEFILGNMKSVHGLETVDTICKLRGFISPEIETRDGMFKAIIRRNESLDIYHGKITIGNICDFCREPKSKLEIYHEFSHKKDSDDYIYFCNIYISPLLRAGVLKLTIPDKPKSKFQKVFTSLKFHDNTN